MSDEDEEEQSLHLHGVINAVAYEELKGQFLWRQDVGKWWVKHPSGVWAPERVEELSTALKEIILQRWPNNYTASLISSIKTLLRSDLAIGAEVFDREPWLLGVQNGIVNLETLTLIDDEREHYITRCCNASYEHGQHNEMWDQHILDLFDGDTEMAWCFQKQIGASLVGDSEKIKPQVFLQLVGASGGGKGTTSRSLGDALGSYARHFSSKDFSEGQDRHTQWMMELNGTRLAIVQEMRTEALDVALLKTLSGGDSLIAHEMRMADQRWVPTHTLLFTSNTAPNFDNDTEGMYRRYVPFTTRLPVMDSGGWYEEDLREDLSGILMWCVRGTAGWLSEDDGSVIALPESVRELRDVDIAGQSMQSEFIQECVSFTGGDLLRSEVRSEYTWWLANVKGDMEPLAQNDKRIQKLYDIINHIGASPRRFTVDGKPGQLGWAGASLIDRNRR